MKTFLLSILILLSAPALSGQTYFAPIGTKWFYMRYQFGPWPPSTPFAVVEAVDTATVQGKPCIVLAGGADCGTLPPKMYIHLENGRASFTTNANDPFLPLYDFNAGVGQTFTTCTPFGENCAKFRVTAVETQVVGTQELQIQHVTLDSGYLSWGQQIIQYAGSSGFLFPQTGACDPELGGLLCFYNGSFSYPEPNSTCGTKITYIPLVTPANEWVADYLFPSFPPEIRRYTFSTDSFPLSGKHYRELIFSKNMSGGPWNSTGQYLREDNGKVFKIWDTNNQPERLLYDMDFGVGDTLPPDPALPGQGDRRIVQVDTIALLDGVPRKSHLLESTLCNGTTRWIEGMGDVERLFWTEVFCSLGEDGPPVLIRCFSTNGQLLYKRSDVDGCYTNSTNDLDWLSMKVYPNPASDVLYFELEDISLINSVNIFDATGHLMLSNQKFLSEGKIDVSHLPNGFYIGIAYFKNETQKSFKIIINR